MINSIRKKRILFFCFFVPIVLLSALFLVKGVYPFGSQSNLMWDMEIQYTDFFAYYRNVLLGRADLSYSFSKSLGGSMIALWGYYLSSPLNLLVVFFKHSQMQLFVFVITALKLGLCGLTFGIFIKSKFKELSELYVLFISVAYAFTQYGVGQMSNIMWLDGMYMLPLMLLAVDKFVYSKKVIPLYVTVALSIIFNWYTAFMNCIFIMIYFTYTYALSVEKMQLKSTVKAVIHFAVAEVAGVLASCFVFLPVLIGQSGGRSAFDEGIFTFETNGSFFEILRGFMIGSNVNSKNITLFCSLFALASIGYYFLNKTVAKREKIISALFLGVMTVSMFFAPLEHIWLGFKFPYSYSYRFLYLALAAFLTITARGLSLEQIPKKQSIKTFLIVSVGVLLLLDMISRFITLRLWMEIAILVLYSIIFCFLHTSSEIQKRALTVALAVLFIGEISINAYWLTVGYFGKDSAKYIEYIENEEALIAQIKEQDNSLYRTEKTLNRDFSVSHDSYYSNEALSYNCLCIQHYSSSYENITAQILKNLGYCRSLFPTFYHDPILGADSLLGVKYLLSEKDYDGYTLRTDLNTYNQKSVYENSYALPLAFSVNEKILDVNAEGKNPFEYLNEIYSGILGEKIAIYTRYENIDKSVAENSSLYAVPKSENNLILYARVSDYNNGVDCKISIDAAEEKSYQGGWMNHNVIVIGNMGTEHSLTVNRNDLDIEFYALDLRQMQAVSDKIGETSVSKLVINKSSVSFVANADKVMLTIPFDECWEVTVNGKAVTPEKGADAFMVIPLNEGEESQVVMKYHTKGVAVGIAVSVLSLLIIIPFALFSKKRLSR